jgi:hypothetical protein
LFVLQRERQLPQLPKGVIFPTIVTGIEGIGRGQDREALTIFLTTLQQTLGPESIQEFVNMEEVTKRLAASVGIDTLGLIKTEEDRQQEKQALAEQAQQQSLTDQTGQILKSPMMDPTKNPNALEQTDDQQTQEGPGDFDEGGPSASS